MRAKRAPGAVVLLLTVALSSLRSGSDSPCATGSLAGREASRSKEVLTLYSKEV